MPRFLLTFGVIAAMLTSSLSTFAQESYLKAVMRSMSSAETELLEDDAWEAPENASLSELWAHYEKMAKAERVFFGDMVKERDARSFALAHIELTDKILAFEDELTREQFEKAVRSKVRASLLASIRNRSLIGEVNSFVNELLKKAESEDEVLFVVKLKYEILCDSRVGSEKRIRNLAENALARPEEKAQSFGLAIRMPLGRLFLGWLFDLEVAPGEDFELGSVDEALDYYESVIHDSNRAQSVRETAMALKLAALLVASGRSGLNDEDDSSLAGFGLYDKTSQKLEEADKYFYETLDSNVTLETRKRFFSLWLWKSVPQYDPDETDETHRRREAILARLVLEEEDRELHDQAYFYQTHRLLEKADYLGDEATALEMDEYADKVLELIDENDPDRVPHSCALKAKARVIRGQFAQAIELIDEYFRDYDDTSEHSAEELTGIKSEAISGIVRKEPGKYDAYAAFVDELLEGQDYLNAAPILEARTVGALEQIADAGGNIDEFNQAIKRFKEDFERCPFCVAAYVESADSIKKIGELNEDANLYDTTGKDIAEFGKALDKRAHTICAVLLQIFVEHDGESGETGRSGVIYLD